MASEDGLAPGRVLYHYTSAPGFLGILERRCLFASDVWFLNDASEVRYAQTRMAERVPAQTDNGGSLSAGLSVGDPARAASPVVSRRRVQSRLRASAASPVVRSVSYQRA